MEVDCRYCHQVVAGKVGGQVLVGDDVDRMIQNSLTQPLLPPRPFIIHLPTFLPEATSGPSMKESKW